MSNRTGVDSREDLVFFGKINASISHELKNVMAIISEIAGYLGDLTEMVGKGEPVKLDILKTCCQEIRDEILRGFDTIQQMNQFAHSVDDNMKQISLTEVIKLMIHIAGFLSIAVKVRFNPPSDVDPMIVTCPFRLQYLIYQAIVYAFESVSSAGEIWVGIVNQENDKLSIFFSGLDPNSRRQFPADETSKMAATIASEIRMSEDLQKIEIVVPKMMAEWENVL